MIKFCEIFTKITFELPNNSQKPLFKCKKHGINKLKSDLCLFFHQMCCKMVWKFMRVGKSYGNWLPGEKNSVRLCEIWHVRYSSIIKHPPYLFRWKCNVSMSHLHNVTRNFDTQPYPCKALIVITEINDGKNVVSSYEASSVGSCSVCFSPSFSSPSPSCSSCMGSSVLGGSCCSGSGSASFSDSSDLGAPS